MLVGTIVVLQIHTLYGEQRSELQQLLLRPNEILMMKYGRFGEVFTSVYVSTVNPLLISPVRTMGSNEKRSKNFHDNAMTNVLREKLFQWTCQRHATNQPLNREILGAKVIDLSIELGLRDFKCSKSWISTFLKKHGFSPSLASAYGPIFNDYREWIELMRSYIRRYRYKNLFQVDEIGMFHDISPENIPRSVHYITCKNGENRENRVTVLLCCNASGMDKLPPVVCGRLENRLLSVNHKCQYYSNQNAWLTPDIFKVWLSQLNTKMSQMNRKILLLLNRTRVHTLKDAVLSNVSLMFFPNDFPASLQPLRSNIFRYVKMIYRRNYTKKMLEPNFNWTMTDTINNIVNAWDSIPNKLILSSFRRTNFRADNNPPQISCPEWESLNLRISFLNYVTFDDNLCVSFSPTRRSKRLAEIKRVRSSPTFYVYEDNSQGGYQDPIELGDSDFDEDVIEEASHSSKISKFGSNSPVESPYDHIAGGSTGRENRDIEKPQNSRPEVTDSDSKQSECIRDDQSQDSADSADYASPLTETVILYISDVVKKAVGKAVNNVPDVMELTSGTKSRPGTGDVTNYRMSEADDEATPIRRKRRKERTDEDDAVSNDDSREPIEKKKLGEQGWSDIYEHSFVFGTRESPRGTNSADADIQTALLQPAINSSQKNDDLEKKGIFLLSGASSSRTQNP